MPNNVSGRRMIDDPLDVAAREPGACGDDGLSDREPVDLRISPIHAFKRDEVAVFVADGDAHIHVELPRLCDRRIHDRVGFRESQRHDTKHSAGIAAYPDCTDTTVGARLVGRSES